MKNKLFLLLTAALFSSPDVNFGQARNASSSSNFAPLAMVGDVGSTGLTSLIAGNANEAVTITPNPFKATTTLIINNDEQLINCELRIYNVLGSEVMRATVTKQITILETGNLPSGIYFYKMITNNIVIQSGRLVSQQ